MKLTMSANEKSGTELLADASTPFSWESHGVGLAGGVYGARYAGRYTGQIGGQVFWGRLALGFSRGLWLGNAPYPQDTPGWSGLQAFMTPHEPEFVANAARTNGIGTLSL